MDSMDKNYNISSLNGIAICSIFDDLQKHLTLCKLSALKTDVAAKSESNARAKLFPNSSTLLTNCPSEAGIRSISSEKNNVLSSEVQESIELEVNLEFANLCKNLVQNVKVDDDLSTSESTHNTSDKFVGDVDNIIQVIRKTKEALQDTNNFSILVEETEKMVHKLNKESELKANISTAKAKIKNLEQKLEAINEEMSYEEQYKMGQINKLKDEHHLIYEDGKETLKFTDTFFEAQSCNTKCSHRDEMEQMSREIAKVKGQIDTDIHCLTVMEAWTDDFCEQLEYKIDQWKLKYRRDELVMEMRVEAKRRAIKTQEELIKSLNETIAERLVELAPWEAEKEVERQERLAHMRRYYSARKIQRWWRGYMVKLKLYRRKKIIKPKA